MILPSSHNSNSKDIKSPSMALFEHASPSWLESFTSRGVNVHCVSDAVTTRERDAAMTRDSDYDILRYRTEAEARELYGAGWWPRVSNTEMNERRRVGDGRQGYGVGAGVGVEGGGDARGGDGGDGEGSNGKKGGSGLKKLFKRG